MLWARRTLACHSHKSSSSSISNFRHRYEKWNYLSTYLKVWYYCARWQGNHNKAEIQLSKMNIASHSLQNTVNTPKTLNMFQHLLVSLRVPPPSENIRKLFTVGMESKGELSVCSYGYVCPLPAYVLLHVCIASGRGAESRGHYYHSALLTIRRHLATWDNHRRVRKGHHINRAAAANKAANVGGGYKRRQRWRHHLHRCLQNGKRK